MSPSRPRRLASRRRNGQGLDDDGAEPEQERFATAVRTSFIGASMRMRGELTLAEDLVIEGHFDGRITQGNHRLSIGEHATVRAEVSTGSAVIAGAVNGSVQGQSTVIVKKTARLRGALTAERLCLEGGANLEDVVLCGSVVRSG